MDGRKRIWPRIASAFLLAIAIGIVWVMVLMWFGYFASMFQATDRVYESVEVMRDGSPVIQSRSSINPMDITYRTLDGQSVDVPSDDRLIPQTSFQKPNQPPGLWETRVGWTSRIAGLSDYQRHGTSWYLVRDSEPMGHAYFVGFDQYSNLPVGYIGRGGFSRVLPAREQWFDVGRNEFNWNCGAIMNKGDIAWASKAYGYAYDNEETQIPTWVAYLIDGDELLAVDLRARSVKSVFKSPGLFSVAALYEVPAEEVAHPPVEDKTAATMTVPHALGTPGAAEARKLLTRIALRSPDRITILDPNTTNKREFTLPEVLREKIISVYSLRTGELLVAWTAWTKETNQSPYATELTWIRPDGTIARQREVVLANYGGQDEQTAAWLAVPVAPIPAGWATILGAIAPLEMVQNHDSADFGEALAKIFKVAAFPFVAVVACGVVLAWLTMRLQRKYRRANSGVWAVFVLLLGLPGFLAYWIENRRAKLEACRQCGKVVPRDREACAACAKEFAPPGRVGTEIFA